MKRNTKKSAPKTTSAKPAVLRAVSPIITKETPLETYLSGHAITVCLCPVASSLKPTVVKP